MTEAADSSQRRASLVAAGIMLSRVLGLVRQRVFAHFFGIGMEADAFTAALRIPNVVRNLMGEGTLSASFIPVYSDLLERGDEEGARRLAGSILAALTMAAGAAAALGVILAPWITRVVALGFDDPTAELTSRIVRVLFPMAGLMVLSGWCLGVLNSHRKFFLTYTAPTLWNVAQIVVLIALGATWAGEDLVMALAWGALGGGFLQLIVQVPAAIRHAGWRGWGARWSDPDTRRVLTAWGPMVFGAGVLQISSVIDIQLASLLPEDGAVASLAYAQMIGMLPVSLFGISVAAVALPELSREVTVGNDSALARRMGDGVQRVLFFTLPAGAAFIVLGRHIVGPILQTGAFGASETAGISMVLAMLGVGLPARALVRLVTSGHYAFGDTRTPVQVAAVTVLVSAGLAYGLMQFMGVSGIALGASLAAFGNVGANYVSLRRRIGTGMGREHLLAVTISVVAAAAAAGAGWQTARWIEFDGLFARAGAVLSVFGVTYLAMTRGAGHPEARRLLRF